MARLPYMKLFVNAFLADTGELSEAEFGAYCKLLMKAWKRGGRLPSDAEELRKLAGCPKASLWAQRWRALERYFEFDDEGFLVNPKLSEERDHALGVRGKRSKAGTASAEKRAQQIPNLAAAVPNSGNSSASKSLENNETASTHVGLRGRVQTAQQIADSEESDRIVPFPLAQQAAPLDDWPAVPSGQMLAEFTATVDSPWFDPMKVVSPKFHAQAPGYLRRWRDAGCSWLADVLPVASARAKVAGSPIQSMKYFDQAILDAHQARTAPYDPATGDHRVDKLARKRANDERSLDGADLVHELVRARGGDGFSGD